MDNKTVNIGELKSRLSEHLRRIRSGGIVTITDHGMPVGRIVPVHADITQRVKAMCEVGLAQWNGKKLHGRTTLVAAAPGKSVSDLLVDDRGWLSTQLPTY